ncbi:MAG: NADH-quinone oxidoreductase subunit N [Nocardioidaceae bacterium]
MIEWGTVGPALAAAVGALVALLLDAFWPHRSWRWPSVAALAGLVAAGALLLRPGGPTGVPLAVSAIVVVASLLVVLGAAVMDHEDAMPPGELHFLLLASTSGALCMVIATDLVTLVVALELLSLPSIAMVGLRRGDVAAARGAWTFFLVSAVSTAITLMGASLLYGVAGTLEYDGLASELGSSQVPDRAVAVAVLITLIGLLFKAGSVPFHMWVPDTYRGASVPVAAYLSVVSKAGAIGALIVLLAGPFADFRPQWAPFVAAVAVLSMTVGNVGALVQRDAIGLLAWSSIAQAGFVLGPMVGLPGQDGAAAPVRYLAVYALANLTAFIAAALVRRLRGGTSFGHMAGLVRSSPWTGWAMTFALLSLAGFPPAVIGLFAKYLVLRPVVDVGYGWLAVAMAVNVALGLVYYLRLIAVLFAPLPSTDRDRAVSPSPPWAVHIAGAAMLAAAGALVVTSVAPDLMLSWLP